MRPVLQRSLLLFAGLILLVGCAHSRSAATATPAEPPIWGDDALIAGVWLQDGGEGRLEFERGLMTWTTAESTEVHPYKVGAIAEPLLALETPTGPDGALELVVAGGRLTVLATERATFRRSEPPAEPAAFGDDRAIRGAWAVDAEATLAEAMFADMPEGQKMVAYQIIRDGVLELTFVEGTVLSHTEMQGKTLDKRGTYRVQSVRSDGLVLYSEMDGRGRVLEVTFQEDRLALVDDQGLYLVFRRKDAAEEAQDREGRKAGEATPATPDDRLIRGVWELDRAAVLAGEAFATLGADERVQAEALIAEMVIILDLQDGAMRLTTTVNGTRDETKARYIVHAVKGSAHTLRIIQKMSVKELHIDVVGDRMKLVWGGRDFPLKRAESVPR